MPAQERSSPNRTDSDRAEEDPSHKRSDPDRAKEDLALIELILIGVMLELQCYFFELILGSGAGIQVWYKGGWTCLDTDRSVTYHCRHSRPFQVNGMWVNVRMMLLGLQMAVSREKVKRIEQVLLAQMTSMMVALWQVLQDTSLNWSLSTKSVYIYMCCKVKNWSKILGL